ncbi:MAG: ribonuclease III [Alphaproteobacteria bacterium]|nr:ribonuclease III [Alphaproteobacteria bacterium]
MSSAERTNHPLCAALGHVFKRRELLERALTHPSDGHGRDDRTDNYERLEFLGDRVLGLVIADLLLVTYKDEREGELARRHTQLVRREALARVAETIGLGAHIQLSASEAETGGRDNPSILADCCEAVIAALYLDGGLPAASGFMHKYWVPLMREAREPPIDPKTALQEWAQGRGLPLPHYRVTGRTGADHAPMFEIEVTVEGLPCVTASGRSKRTGENEAAQLMLDAISESGDG